MDKNLTEHFANLESKLQSPDFLNNQGLANEVGYYIFPYDIKDELKLQDLVADLSHSDLARKVNLKIFDLYDIMLKRIDDLKGLADGDPMEMLYAMEKSDGLQFVSQQINNLLEMDKNDNGVVQEINKEISGQKCVVLITGVGKVYPVLRAHKVLNTMHQVLDENPVIMLYPGDYDELSLRIFNETKDQNYYRAFPI